MKTRHKRLFHCLPLLAALTAAPALWAQATAAPQTPQAPAAEPEVRVGDATHSLLQRQREGREASPYARPIDGRVADLSHQRYLKSFEQPVPPWFNSGLGQKK
ncbi:DUF3613 domain-containing protein [Hydrogenophaga laconesensis]|uniref:DUF3613 domain-containing protein n=1 Tax=Hydrogenophaga laconesensis TaxID=1805971 RepID=A0ABU1VHR9_9BURK|nr:DUF3613 domain-containing protein [Hydrogenophaga laconesensis]MDR7097034.1 hypothetical protein [Hydrogenophaga laconesensis]